MDTKFKIGDKVRIVSYPNPKRVGQIAVIDTICPMGSKFQYVLTIGNSWVSSVYKNEIESVLRKGEQLLFEFMV